MTESATRRPRGVSRIAASFTSTRRRKQWVRIASANSAERLEALERSTEALKRVLRRQKLQIGAAERRVLGRVGGDEG